MSVRRGEQPSPQPGRVHHLSGVLPGGGGGLPRPLQQLLYPVVHIPVPLSVSVQAILCAGGKGCRKAALSPAGGGRPTTHAYFRHSESGGCRRGLTSRRSEITWATFTPDAPAWAASSQNPLDSGSA